MHGVNLHFWQAGLWCRAAIHSPVTASLPVTYCRNLVPFPEKEQPSCLIYSLNTLASDKVGQQSFTSCLCSGKRIWLSVHPHSAWPSASLFVNPAISVVMFQTVGTMTHSFLSKGRKKRKQNPASLLLFS